MKILNKIIVTLTILASQTGQAKPAIYPKVGEPCPNFELKNVEDFHKKDVTLNDFKGKWLVLDFWGEFCSGCIASFPNINELQKEFKDSIQFLLITDTYQNPQTAKTFYKKIKSKFDLTVPIVFENDVVRNFGVNGLPTIIVIDPRGIVKAITLKITRKNIQDLLAGKPTDFRPAYLLNQRPYKDYDYTKPLLLDNNGGDEQEFISRSLFVKCKPTMPTYSVAIDTGRIELFRMTLRGLYNFAFTGTDFWTNEDTTLYGKFYRKPILEVADSSLFQTNNVSLENYFCYSSWFRPIKLSDDRKFLYNFQNDTLLQEKLQRDLENNFNFEARIEMREMPYYRLTAAPDALSKLKTKYKDSSSFEAPYGRKAGFVAKNVPMNAVITCLLVAPDAIFHKGLDIVDETGIKDNVDFDIKAIYTDDWLKELKNYGLSVELARKKMKTIVIRDKNKSIKRADE